MWQFFCNYFWWGICGCLVYMCPFAFPFITLPSHLSVALFAPGYNSSSTSTLACHQLTYSFAHYNFCVKDGNKTSMCIFGSDDDSMVSHHSQCWGIKCGISGGGASWLFAKNKYIAGVESGWGVEYDAHHIDHNVKGLKIFTLLFLLIPSCYKQHWEPCTCHSWWCEWEQKIHNMRCWFTGKYFLVAEVL